MKVILEKSIYAKMLNQRGYSIVSLATIVGEVGDIRRFPNHRKFASYCGLAVSENQSGKAKSVNCFITKRGNKYLRSMFYNMVLPQLAAKEGFSDFYHRLKSKGKASKECMVAVSRKIAVKTYYDMLRCHDENLNLQQ
jgi:transposase